MNKKVAGMIAAAFVSGAGATKVADLALNSVKVTSIEIVVHGDGSAHRNVYGTGAPERGVLAAKCDDSKAQKRLKAEIAAAASECTFP